ncbi:MAG: GH3 auxin-responsive promoter family protein, partial [Phycisphaerae bacterium]
MTATARHAYHRFVRAAHDAVAVQERQWRSHVRRHATSDFGRQNGFDRIASYDDFRRALPVADYRAFAPAIERMRRGEFRALLGPRQRVLMFALTSGTTAEPKYIPVTDEFLRAYRRGWNIWGHKTLLDHSDAYFRGIVQITSPMREHESEAGIPCGAITGILAATQLPIVRRYYIAPGIVADIHDSSAKHYT